MTSQSIGTETDQTTPSSSPTTIAEHLTINIYSTAPMSSLKAAIEVLNREDPQELETLALERLEWSEDGNVVSKVLEVIKELLEHADRP